jgi:hypothetical protein
MEACIDPGIARYDRSLASCRIQVVLELALGIAHGQKMRKQVWVRQNIGLLLNQADLEWKHPRVASVAAFCNAYSRAVNHLVQIQVVGYAIRRYRLMKTISFVCVACPDMALQAKNVAVPSPQIYLFK